MILCGAPVPDWQGMARLGAARLARARLWGSVELGAPSSTHPTGPRTWIGYLATTLILQGQPHFLFLKFLHFTKSGKQQCPSFTNSFQNLLVHSLHLTFSWQISLTSQCGSSALCALCCAYMDCADQTYCSMGTSGYLNHLRP